MQTRPLLAALAITLAAGAAHAQYYPATYQEPYCREFTKVVQVGGRPESAYGQACMQPDGSWQIVSDDIPATQPVQYYPQQNYVAYQPMQSYAPAISSFSLSFNSYNPNRHRYYNRHGHGWRDWDRGRGRDRQDNHRDRGRGHERGQGRGHDRHR